ncbi:UDP-glycosyltransferase 79B3 [Linum perenne]
MKKSDALGIRTCNEIEGKLCEYLGKQYRKPVFLTGPILPEPMKAVLSLENRWVEWLGKFEPHSVVFCAFGSQIILEKNQFQEIVLGFELSGYPFLVVLKPPTGSSTIQEALPEGFEDRVKERGIVCNEWVQQVALVNHSSILNTRLMADELRVGLEVERDEKGWVSKEKLSEAIKCVMDKGNELGCTLRRNHAKWRNVVSDHDFMSSYIDKFVQNLNDLVK